MKCGKKTQHPHFCVKDWENIAPLRGGILMRDKPISDYSFLLLVIALTVIFLFSLAQLVRAEPDTDAGILDQMIGYKVRDFNYNTDFIVTPSPIGGYVVRDPKHLYPLYKVEKGKIYNYKREPQRTIGNGTKKNKAVQK
jgi:hypothetical protein